MYAKRFLKRSNNPTRKGQWNNYMNTAQNAMRLASTTASVVNKISQLVNAEKKYVTTNSSSNPSSGSPALINLTQIAQGDTENTRSGNRVLLHDFVLRYYMYANQSGAEVQIMELLIFVDTQNDGSDPTEADIFDDTGNILSFYNPDNTERFITLYHKRIPLSKDGHDIKMLSMYEKLNFHLNFDGVNAADTNTNTMYMMVKTDQAALSPTMYYSSKLQFYDN